MAGEESFETLIESLEQLAAQLEEGGLGLDDALKTYEDGVKIAGRLRKVLTEAELRIEELQLELERDRNGLRDLPEDYVYEDEEDA